MAATVGGGIESTSTKTPKPPYGDKVPDRDPRSDGKVPDRDPRSILEVGISLVTL